jgi:hypothetical protein
VEEGLGSSLLGVRGGLGPVLSGLRKEGWGLDPGSEGGVTGPGPLGLREEAGPFPPGSEGGGWACIPGSDREGGVGWKV